MMIRRIGSEIAMRRLVTVRAARKEVALGSRVERLHPAVVRRRPRPRIARLSMSSITLTREPVMDARARRSRSQPRSCPADAENVAVMSPRPVAPVWRGRSGSSRRSSVERRAHGGHRGVRQRRRAVQLTRPMPPDDRRRLHFEHPWLDFRVPGFSSRMRPRWMSRAAPACGSNYADQCARRPVPIQSSSSTGTEVSVGFNVARERDENQGCATGEARLPFATGCELIAAGPLGAEGVAPALVISSMRSDLDAWARAELQDVGRRWRQPCRRLDRSIGSGFVRRRSASRWYKWSVGTAATRARQQELVKSPSHRAPRSSAASTGDRVESESSCCRAGSGTRAWPGSRSELFDVASPGRRSCRGICHRYGVAEGVPTRPTRAVRPRPLSASPAGGCLVAVDALLGKGQSMAGGVVLPPLLVALSGSARRPPAVALLAPGPHRSPSESWNGLLGGPEHDARSAVVPGRRPGRGRCRAAVRSHSLADGRRLGSCSTRSAESRTAPLALDQTLARVTRLIVPLNSGRHLHHRRDQHARWTRIAMHQRETRNWAKSRTDSEIGARRSPTTSSRAGAAAGLLRTSYPGLTTQSSGKSPMTTARISSSCARSASARS